MSKIIGVTEARSKLRMILEDVSKKGESYVLTRGSRPEAVIISYKEYQALQEQSKSLWNKRFETALKKTRAHFTDWLRQKGYELEKLTDEEIERIIESA